MGNVGPTMTITTGRTLLLAILLLLCPGAKASEPTASGPTTSGRIWTDRSGEHTVEAQFVQFKDGVVQMRTTDGRVLTVRITALSTADQQYVREMLKQQNVSPTEKPAAASQKPVGADANVGCRDNPKKVQRLSIKEPGVYENYLVDGEWVDRILVKIQTDNVTLRNCEIRNGRHNGISIYAKNVLIENCKIHHLLAGTFRDQEDAHGIDGQPTNLVIRNCEIYYVSGDCLQFDPSRNPWDNVLIENCTMWTGPLPADAAGFRRGERPGENAVDTKQRKSNPRSRITIKNCLMVGWGDGQISNQAALNLKNHVQVDVIGCVLADNDICFRLRGDTGEYGGALVNVQDCAVYRSQTAVRLEDALENLKITRLGIGEGIQRKYQVVAGEPRGYVNQGEFTPPPYATAIRTGVGP